MTLNKITTLLVTILIVNNTFSQVFLPKNMDEKSIVAKFLETKWNENDSTYKWIPNLSESFQFSRNDNRDTLITKIDTIFNYVENEINKKIILLSTNTFNNSCHACQPSLGLIELSFDKSQDSLEIVNVNKYIDHIGSWGQSPKKRSLQQIDKDKFCLKVTDYGMSFGFEVGVTSFFIDSKKVLSFTSYESNHNAVEFDYQKYQFKSFISFNKKSNTLKIIKIGKEPNSRGKIVKVHTITTYKYNGEFLEKISKKNIVSK